MRLSPYKYDLSDDGMNKADAAIFRSDVVGRLQEGRPNWAYQRLFGEFKLPGTENDPFEDAELRDTQPAASTREQVRGQLVGYADRVFTYQHRTAVYSYIVFGRMFRFLRWDRAGVFVTQKVDYIKDTRTFVELLLGFLVLDDASQGIDTTVTLLEEGSEAFKLMSALARGDQKVLKMPVLSYNEGDVLPSSIPVETHEVPLPPPAPHAHDASADSNHDSRPEQHAATSSTSPSPPAATTTVTRPKEGSFVFQYTLDYFASSLTQDWPRYRVPIGNDTFLVARPIFETAGLTGRGTRGYIAWHEQSRSFVFLKDAWRPFYQGVEMEGDILKRLNDAGVEHIPTLLCHGQVASQRTLVSDYAQYVDTRTNDERKAESRTKSGGTSKGKKRAREGEHRHHIRHYAHHRLATKEVCLPLVAFKSSKQLVSLICDCVDGHAGAVNKCGLLHRDISCGNILILPTFEQRPGDSKLYLVWKGVLCDWELSKPIALTKKDEKARQPERTGTWRYMSVASLRNMLHVVGIADEIESFFNVILYNAIRYLPHNAGPYTATMISSYFTRAEKQSNGILIVGDGKFMAITQHGYLPVGPTSSMRRLCFGSQSHQNQGLNFLLGRLMQWFKARYEVLFYEDSTAASLPDTPDTPDPELSPREAQRPRLEPTRRLRPRRMRTYSAIRSSLTVLLVHRRRRMPGLLI
ncbi:hypothetical protein C8T65DRAFT_817896 [Cerioporus squamosus]|nr:hypothetical protein C8T65DRAFT_817896 [Cerioporus squamosus]